MACGTNERRVPHPDRHVGRTGRHQGFTAQEDLPRGRQQAARPTRPAADRAGHLLGGSAGRGVSIRGSWVPGPEGSPTATARPDGISVLAVFEVIVALVGLYVARDLAYWSNWGFSYDNFREGVVDGAMALAYLATSMTGFVVAWRMWSMRASAWWTAVLLNTALLGLILVGIVLWGVETTDLIGIPVNLGVLWYLN